MNTDPHRLGERLADLRFDAPEVAPIYRRATRLRRRKVLGGIGAGVLAVVAIALPLALLLPLGGVAPDEQPAVEPTDFVLPARPPRRDAARVVPEPTFDVRLEGDALAQELGIPIRDDRSADNDPLCVTRIARRGGGWYCVRHAYHSMVQFHQLAARLLGQRLDEPRQMERIREAYLTDLKEAGRDHIATEIQWTEDRERAYREGRAAASGPFVHPADPGQTTMEVVDARFVFPYVPNGDPRVRPDEGFAKLVLDLRWPGASYPGEVACEARLLDVEDAVVGRWVMGMQWLEPTYSAEFRVPVTGRPSRAIAWCGESDPPTGIAATSDVSLARVDGDMVLSATLVPVGEAPMVGAHRCALSGTGTDGAEVRYEWTAWGEGDTPGANEVTFDPFLRAKKFRGAQALAIRCLPYTTGGGGGALDFSL